MIHYSELSPIFRDLICFWIILIILGFVTNAVFSIRQKRYLYTGVSVAGTVFLYVLMQICRDVSLWKNGSILHRFTEIADSLPAAVFIIILALFSGVFVVHLRSNLSYNTTHISSSSVKEAVDQNPAGICYYRDNGQLILANHSMNALAFMLTDRALMNGAEFYEAIKDSPVTELPDGTVIRFSHKELTLGGEPCHELTADDITEFYRKSEALRKDNERLASQNKRMKEYGETIDDTVRHQEVLNTKTRIHDEMNRLLLSTDNAIREGTDEEKQKIIETWQKNILLLCMEADSDVKNNALSDLDALAKLIGVKLMYDIQPQTEDAETLLLFSLATEEAMANAAKHGGAKQLFINITEENDMLTAVFTDDGNFSGGMVREGGGLSALRSRIELSGGDMQISSENKFILTVTIPEGGKGHVL